jgi:hypothetical protein
MRLWWVSVLFVTTPQENPAPVDFYGKVQPILAIHCVKCHGPEVQKGKLRLDVRDRVLKSGTPAEIGSRIQSTDPDEQMPPKGPRLTAEEISTLVGWIKAGTPWPDRDDYWAFQPPKNPTPPSVKPNPIDAFIATPEPEADRRTLLRRAFGDLIGLPPTPEEADAFLNDPSADAFEKLVDRLLADPRYGERWARHWLDLVRYSESDGYEDDKVRPHAWRYRDYVIRALNADTPYDRFIAEQLAGDELFPDNPDAWIATGFARLGAWDGMSKVPKQQRQDYLNDATDAAGSVFLGMTVGCARCHDHKYDRITQRDYYGLQAFFAGGVRETKSLPSDPGDPDFVKAAWRKADAELQVLRAERDALRREARELVFAKRRCEVGPDAQVKITDDEVNKMCDMLQPGKRGAMEGRIKDLSRTERLHRPAAEVVVESRTPPVTHLLRNGELATPGPEIPPSFVEAMVPPGKTAAPGRRPALVRWLTSADHPLTSRVMVNRLWQHHFGRGIVATPSDFGRNGRRPTHPELLDWLARRFVADGWSLKKMHRLMMTSAAYRRAGGPLRRLEAEVLRDSILAVSGRLSPIRGGPGVYVPIPKDVNVMLPNNDKELSWEQCTEEEARRRTLYVFQRRSLTLPMVDVFDGPSQNQTCPQRPETTVAPQALTLFNGEFCRGEARHFAARVEKEAGAGIDARINRAFRLALIRAPREEERAAARAFLSKQSLADFCHVLLNTNEFLYLD